MMQQRPPDDIRDAIINLLGAASEKAQMDPMAIRRLVYDDVASNRRVGPLMMARWGREYPQIVVAALRTAAGHDQRVSGMVWRHTVEWLDYLPEEHRQSMAEWLMVHAADPSASDLEWPQRVAALRRLLALGATLVSKDPASNTMVSELLRLAPPTGWKDLEAMGISLETVVKGIEWQSKKVTHLPVWRRLAQMHTTDELGDMWEVLSSRYAPATLADMRAKAMHDIMLRWGATDPTRLRRWLKRFPEWPQWRDAAGRNLLTIFLVAASNGAYNLKALTSLLETKRAAGLWWQSDAHGITLASWCLFRGDRILVPPADYHPLPPTALGAIPGAWYLAHENGDDQSSYQPMTFVRALTPIERWQGLERVPELVASVDRAWDDARAVGFDNAPDWRFPKLMKTVMASASECPPGMPPRTHRRLMILAITWGIHDVSQTPKSSDHFDWIPKSFWSQMEEAPIDVESVDDPIWLAHLESGARRLGYSFITGAGNYLTRRQALAQATSHAATLRRPAAAP